MVIIMFVLSMLSLASDSYDCMVFSLGRAWVVFNVLLCFFLCVEMLVCACSCVCVCVFFLGVGDTGLHIFLRLNQIALRNCEYMYMMWWLCS